MITHHQEINFQQLKIKKRTDNQLQSDAYLNVCLVLDNDIVNQLCTDETKGFSDSDQESITWDMPKENVHKVDLVFRDTGAYDNPHSGFATVKDLKIYYFNTGMFIYRKLFMFSSWRFQIKIFLHKI